MMSSENIEIAEYHQFKQKLEEQIQIHQEMDNEDLILKFQKTMKSNSIKVILYHFVDFMRSRGDDIIIEALSKTKDKPITQIRKEFTSFLKQKKLNQHAFLSLYNSLRFSGHLEYYLNYYSTDAILENNMKDYENHVVCLAFLQRCFTCPDLITFIRTYRKKQQSALI